MIMEEWKEYKLGDVANVKGGKRLPKGINLTTIANTHPYIRVRDLGTKKILELDSSYEYVDDETQKSISKYIVNSGDIILSIVGTIGLVAVIGTTLDGANLTENCVKLINVNKIDKEYLYYYLSSDIGKSEIEKGTVGAVQAKLPIKNIQSINIKAPAIELQKRIASILKSLDDKIEVNRRINENLEQQAQALFKSWFVDFEPFKDQPFVESELGMIPHGWRVGNLFDVAEILDKFRKPLSGKDRESMNKVYPYYGATSCMDYVDNYLFDGIFTLIGEDGSVAREDGLPYMQYVWGKLWVNNHAHILQGKNGFSTEMLHAMLSITNIQHLVTGAVQAKLSQANMQKILVAIPPVAVLDKIRPAIDALYEIKRNKEDESRRLAELRDTLLPRLMSGELKVDEVNV